MKALIRKPGETVTEKDNVHVDWKTGAPLTNPEWYDGPYMLVEDYVETAEDTDVPQTVQAIEDTAPETVQIGDRTYSLEDLKKLVC